MTPKESAGDAVAARTAKFTWYEHHASGRATRGVAAPELASEVSALLSTAG